ncbi:MarR family transcriptional regulator [Leifsonia sp. ZF2019]|uniref:MarR family winged helix-turn-helix transcriptional regulator n=1 Tax=Leifsonia sp. ZF2019 TaxID=2781978 RepID=UPI001CBE4F09|nr:MarR family transcriptional regulator [Leifsonia sp. ZF2019]UAJ78368.1 MarR family transcriptional regulator [Leifsonia sp. ZF2019]
MEADASDPDDLRELDEEVTRAVARIYRRFRAERAEGELGDAALSALGHLHRHGPTSLGALSEHEKVTPASMSQTVNRLTSLALAARTPDPDDGRRVLLALTEEGHALAAASREQRHRWFRERLAGLSTADREVLRRAASILGGIADD